MFPWYSHGIHMVCFRFRCVPKDFIHLIIFLKETTVCIWKCNKEKLKVQLTITIIETLQSADNSEKHTNYVNYYYDSIAFKENSRTKLLGFTHHSLQKTANTINEIVEDGLNDAFKT